MALDPNINRIKFHRTKTAGAAPTTANVSEGELAFNLADKTIYTNDGTNIVRIGDPDRLMKYDILGASTARLANAGAIFSGGTVNGALVLSLPKAKFNSTTMLKIRLDGYNYTQGAAWSLELAGYNYTGSTWHNVAATLTSGGALTPFIRALSNEDATNSVKFGASSDRNIIVIGRVNTQWIYPDIQISEVLLGHVNSTNGGWDSDWKLEFVSDQTVLDSYTYSTGQGQPLLYGVNRTLTSDKLFTPRNINGVSFDGSSNITVYDSTKLPLTGGTVTGTLIVSGSLTANTNIQNTTGNNLGFLNGGSALGINVGNILVSNSYSDVSKVPVNGMYVKGGIDSDEKIQGPRTTSYTTLTQIGNGVAAPFRAKDGNIGSTYGYCPVLNWNTLTTSGNQQVNHIGTYRPSADGTSSGVYIATGIGAAAYEAFLFQNGRTISNTNGQVLLKGVADYSNSIDATPGNLYGTAAGGWRRLGVATIPQAGRVVTLNLFGGTGFNAGNPQQARSVTIILKTGNGTPATGINVVVEAQDGQNLFRALSPDTGVCVVPLGNNQYEVWIYALGYLSASLVPTVGAFCSWVNDFTAGPPNGAVKPAGAVDAAVFTIANAGISNVASADKLTTPRLINGVAFDGTANINVQQVSAIIPSNSDLNTYITEGFYHCATNVSAQSIANSPLAGTAFSLLVEKTAGVKQTWTTYATGGALASRTFIRNIYSGAIGEWREVAFTDNATFSGVSTFTGAVNVSGLTSTSGLINNGTLRSTGTTHLGNTVELGTIGTAGNVNIDFHSSANDIDYDSRIVANGGTSGNGNGSLSYIASGHTFTGTVVTDALAANRFGILNNVATNQLGISLYGGASTGKPSYGFMFTGTANAGLGSHGDVDGQWSVYVTCATAGTEKRGWIFHRSDTSTNVASISTNGVLSTNGSISTLGDNTMINVGNNNNLALVKKAGGNPFVGVGLNTTFRVAKSNLAAVDPSNTFTDLFTVRSNGDLDITGNTVYIGNGIANNVYESIQFGNYTKAASGGGFSILHMAPVGSSGERVLQLANYTQAGAAASALYVNNSGTYQTLGTTTLKLATVDDNVASSTLAAAATKLQTARTIGGVSFDGTANINLPGVNTAGNQSTSGNAATATTLQTARLIGGVSFNGSANINLPGVNVAGNQNTSGNAATATALQNVRQFSVIGAVTAAAVSFNGTQNVALNATSVDGTKVTGKVPSATDADTAITATRAQSVDVNGLSGTKLSAVWNGCVFGDFTPTATAITADTLKLSLSTGVDAVTQDMISNFKVGSTIVHLLLAGTGTIWAQTVQNCTVVSIDSGRSDGKFDVTVSLPSHGIGVGNATGTRVLAATYSAKGCSFLGTIGTEMKASVDGGVYSYLIRTASNIALPSITSSVSADKSFYSNTLGYSFLSDNNPNAMATSMSNANTCNFIVTDNNNDYVSRAGMVNIQIWDMI